MSLRRAGWVSWGASGLFVLGVLCSASAAAADDSTPNGSRFGATGAVAFDRILGYNSVAGFGGQFGAASNKLTYDYGTAGRYTYRSDTAWVSPTIDVFVGHGVSVGLASGIHHARSRYSGLQDVAPIDDAVTRWSLQPRVGYGIHLVDEIAFWPRLSIGYTGAWGDGGAQASPLSRAKGWIGSVSVPVILAPSRHLFFAVGPELEVQSLDGEVEPSMPTGMLVERRAVSLQWAGGVGVVL